MKQFVCEKCGSIDLYINTKGTQSGLYCSDCGKWIKWLGKDELRLAERFIEDFKNNQKETDSECVTMPYDSYIDILAKLNKSINACNNGHGNSYLWRELSGIATQLTDHYSGDKNIFKDVIKLMDGQKYKSN